MKIQKGATNYLSRFNWVWRICLVASLILIQQVNSATILVETNGDDNAPCGSTQQLACASIVEGFNSVQSNGDIIQLGAGTFNSAANRLIQNPTTLSVTVKGAGKTQTIIEVNGDSYFFRSNNGAISFTFEDLTVRGATGSAFQFTSLTGVVTFKNVHFDNNDATFGGACSLQNSAAYFIGCTFTDNTAYEGGAIYLEQASSLHIYNSEFIDNSATGSAGAISVSPDPTMEILIDGCNFTSNSATDRAGAIYLQATSRTIIKHSSFKSNSAKSGGAIWIPPTTSSIANYFFETCTFIDNSATGTFAGTFPMYAGGAIRSDAHGEIFDCTFTHNTAAADGGAIFATDQLQISNSKFNDNYVTAGSSGGALSFTLTSVPVIRSTSFTNNTAAGHGGAIDVESNDFDIADSVFTSNKATQDGAGIYAHAATTSILSHVNFYSNEAGQNGGAISTGGVLTITGSKLESNKATSGGAIFCITAVVGPTPHALTITSSSFNSNNATSNGGAVYSATCNVVVSDSTFDDNNAEAAGTLYAGRDSTLTATTITGSDSVSGGAAWFGNGDVKFLSVDVQNNNNGGITVVNPTAVSFAAGSTSVNNNGDDLHLTLSGKTEVQIKSTTMQIGEVYVSGGKFKIESGTDQALNLLGLHIDGGAVVSVGRDVVITDSLEWSDAGIEGFGEVAPSLTFSGNGTLYRGYPHTLSWVHLVNKGKLIISNTTNAATREVCLHLLKSAEFTTEKDSTTVFGAECTLEGLKTGEHGYFVNGGNLSWTKYLNITAGALLTPDSFVNVHLRQIDDNDRVNFANTLIQTRLGGTLRVVNDGLEITTASDLAFPVFTSSQTFVGNFTKTIFEGTNDVYGIIDIGKTNALAAIHIGERYRPNLQSGLNAAAIVGTILVLIFVIAVALYLKSCICPAKEDDDSEDSDEENPKEKDPLTKPPTDKTKKGTEDGKEDGGDKDKKKKNKGGDTNEEELKEVKKGGKKDVKEKGPVDSDEDTGKNKKKDKGKAKEASSDEEASDDNKKSPRKGKDDDKKGENKKKIQEKLSDDEDSASGEKPELEKKSSKQKNDASSSKKSTPKTKKSDKKDSSD